MDKSICRIGTNPLMDASVVRMSLVNYEQIYLVGDVILGDGCGAITGTVRVFNFI